MDEDSSMEHKTRQVYSLGKRNVFRLHLTDSVHGFVDGSGQEECSCPDQQMRYDAKLATCPECKKPAKGTLPAGDVPLKYNDVMIVATQSAFLFSVPIGGFALAMAKRKLKVAVNTTREEGGCGSVLCYIYLEF